MHFSPRVAAIMDMICRRNVIMSDIQHLPDGIYEEVISQSLVRSVGMVKIK